MAEARGTILVVEDEPEIRRFLRSSLGAEGYKAVESPAGQRGALDAGMHKPDLVIVDLGLPDLDGVEVIRRIREWSPMPILVVSARTQERSKVEALDAGADDYVTKPFRLAELLARIRALLRRGSIDSIQEVQDLRVDAESRRAWLGGDELQLTAKEFDLLRVLVRDAGRVVTRDQLMREVWDTTWWSSTKTLDMHISWLRRKLGDDAHSPRYITTVRGVGFRFERGD